MKAIHVVLPLLFICSIANGQSTAKLYVYRATGYNGSAVGYSLFVDDTLVCKLNNNRYSIHDIAPGERKISTQFYGKGSKDKAESITIMVESGRTYYVELEQTRVGVLSKVYPQEIGESSTRKLMEKCKLDADCKVK